MTIAWSDRAIKAHNFQAMRRLVNREVALVADPVAGRNSNLKMVCDGRSTTYLKRQLDGTLIDICECSCPSLVHALEFEGSIDCPIDDHRIWWLRWHWEFDDHGQVFSSPAIWPSDRISQGRRTRSPGVSGARISA